MIAWEPNRASSCKNYITLVKLPVRCRQVILGYQTRLFIFMEDLSSSSYTCMLHCDPARTISLFPFAPYIQMLTRTLTRWRRQGLAWKKRACQVSQGDCLEPNKGFTLKRFETSWKEQASHSWLPNRTLIFMLDLSSSLVFQAPMRCQHNILKSLFIANEIRNRDQIRIATRNFDPPSSICLIHRFSFNVLFSCCNSRCP